MKQELPATKPPPTGSKDAAKQARLAREAAALRANLRRRKDQARERASDGEPPKPAPAIR
jgi:hypothetical protein